jgi:hypothetical protein
MNPPNFAIARYRDLLQLHQLLRSLGELPALPTRRAFGLGKWIFAEQDEARAALPWMVAGGFFWIFGMMKSG